MIKYVVLPLNPIMYMVRIPIDGFGCFVFVGEQPSHISYLPLAHIYERFVITLVTHFGGAIGFYRGNVLELLEDVEELRPTTFASVPRLYNRIYDKVLAQVRKYLLIPFILFFNCFVILFLSSIVAGILFTVQLIIVLKILRILTALFH